MTLKQESVNKDQVKDYLIGLQNNIVGTIELVDGKNFLHDSWQRKEGGGGTTCIMENGYVFERGLVFPMLWDRNFLNLLLMLIQK